MKNKQYKKSLIPIHLRRAVLFRDKGICQYCGKNGKPGWYPDKVFEIIHGKEVAFEIDHIVPEFLGGKTILDNLILACRECNRSKGWRNNGTRKNVKKAHLHK